jgi:hypothetical protein
MSRSCIVASGYSMEANVWSYNVLCTNSRSFKYVFVCACTWFVCFSMLLYVVVYTCIYIIYMYIYICMHIYIHVYISKPNVFTSQPNPQTHPTRHPASLLALCTGGGAVSYRAKWRKEGGLQLNTGRTFLCVFLSE